MALENLKDMLNKAKINKYAVPQFNVWNLEWISAVLDECQKISTPVILGVSVNGAKYMGGYYVVSQIIKSYIKSNNIDIPVAIHLDHSPSFEECKNAIDGGFTSVMIDASKEVLENNIAITKKVVEYAHSKNVTVEAELGRIGGKEDFVVAESSYAIPSECLRLVKETKIDTFAPALGSVHGVYHGEPKLGFKQMKEIQELTDLPLVLHGGSGLPNEQLKKAISCGTCKINVNTDCLLAWKDILNKVLKDNPNEIDPRKIIGPGKIGIANVIKEKCTVFGSIGKANYDI